MARGGKRLQREQLAPLLLQECANAPRMRSANTVYANASGRCSVALPLAFGAHVSAQLSDTHYHALVFPQLFYFVKAENFWYHLW